MNALHTIIGPITIIVVPLAAAVDGAIALFRGWRPGNVLDWIVLISSTVILFGAVACLSTSAGRRLCRSRLAELTLLGGVIITLSLALEFTLRTLSPSSDPVFHHGPPNLSARVKVDYDISNDDKSVTTFSTNSTGIRGPEFAPESDYRILCIGGSTTQCYYLDDSETWTHKLMTKLGDAKPVENVWVGAAGVPGYSTAQHLQYIQTVPTANQYSHFVFMIGVNDLLVWLGFRQNASPTASAISQPVWYQTATYERARTAIENSFGVDQQWGTVTDAWSLESSRDQRRNATIVDEYPPIGRLLQGYAERIEGMIEEARLLGSEPVFLTQPVLWSEELPDEITQRLWTGRMRGGAAYLSVSKLRELMDRINATLLRVCRQQNVMVIDLSFMSGNSGLFFDDCHFTAEGAELIADRLAKRMLTDIGEAPAITETPNE